MTNSKQKCLRPVTRQAVHHAAPVHPTVHHAALMVHHTAHHSVVHHDVIHQGYEQPKRNCSAPEKVCVTKDITITECEDKVENKCFNVAKFVNAINTLDHREIIIREGSCEQITLTPDTQAYRQQRRDRNEVLPVQPLPESVHGEEDAESTHLEAA